MQAFKKKLQKGDETYCIKKTRASHTTNHNIKFKMDQVYLDNVKSTNCNK